MAIVRCESCGLDMRKTQKEYHTTPVLPIGFPDTGVICGRKGCTNPGKVWLEKIQYVAYQNGERYFGVKTNTVKIKVI